MKKSAIALSLLLIILAGCSGMQIREEGGISDEKYLYDTIGKSVIIFKSMDETLFRYNIRVMKELLNNNRDIRPAERETRMKALENAVYSPDTFFFFEIRHIKPYKLSSSVTIKLADSAGANLIADIMYDSGTYGDGVNSYICIVKSKKAVVKDNFKEGELPVVFTAEFLKQKKQYRIFPE
jgi:hypothetical protein